jgi:ABC-type multidrug transport system ATPase subunit
MNSLAIETTGVHHCFTPAAKTLNDINVQVERGSIYGFIGPNGAGKTTTLSIILGLLPLQAGGVRIFDQDLVRNRTAILKRTGSMIETPSLYGHLTAAENLSIYRKLYGASKNRIAEVLALVDLTDTGQKRSKNFSLGMKARLALAVALLPNPELLILDEPTNGLDPHGIIEFRELIKKLNGQFGTTILVSSHILPEVEKMATHIGVIFQGKLKFQGTMAELRQMQRDEESLVIQTSNNEGAFELLKKFSPTLSADSIILKLDSPRRVSVVNRLLIDNNIEVYQLQQRKTDLEQLYLNFTSK